jgi:hypothetical protein
MKHGFFPVCAWYVGFIAAMTPLVSANPIAPPNVPILSEIQVMGDQDWRVEVDCNSNTFPGLMEYPCSTYAFSLSVGGAGPVHPDSLSKPAVPEVFDSAGIAVLTPEHFPGLNLAKDSTIILRTKMGSSVATWQTHIPDNLSPQQSIIGVRGEYCCEKTGYGCVMVCTRPAYSITNCPTIGTLNRKSLGSIMGTVKGPDGQSIEKLTVCLIQAPASATVIDTVAQGNFAFTNLDSCNTYTLSFADLNGIPVSDTAVGPLKIIAGGTVNIQMRFSTPLVRVASLAKDAVAGDVRLLSAPVRGGIALAVSGFFVGRGTITIAKPDGSVIRSLVVPFHGPGTYTIRWNGRNERDRRVSPGTYLCRVKIGESVSCKGFIVW